MYRSLGCSRLLCVGLCPPCFDEPLAPSIRRRVQRRPVVPASTWLAQPPLFARCSVLFRPAVAFVFAHGFTCSCSCVPAGHRPFPPITPHHILHTARSSRKPHSPLAPPRHSYYTPCTAHTLHLPLTYHTWHNPSHLSHLSHTPHPHYTTSTHHTHSSPNTSHHPSLILAHMQV